MTIPPGACTQPVTFKFVVVPTNVIVEPTVMFPETITLPQSGGMVREDGEPGTKIVPSGAQTKPPGGAKQVCGIMYDVSLNDSIGAG